MRPLKNANFCLSSRKAKILTAEPAPCLTRGIYLVFRGLKFEPDPRGIGFAFHRAGTEIGQKGAFCKGLICMALHNSTVQKRFYTK
jgi:hypothetical protein